MDKKKIKILSTALFIFFNLILSAYSNTPPDQTNEKDLVSLINKVLPPPKSINDVIKLLDNSKADVESVEKYKQIINSTPDPSLKGIQLFEHHQRQFEALEQLGLVKELEQNCLKGIEIAGEISSEVHHDVASNIYLNAQINCLNFHSIEGDRKKALDRIENVLKNPQIQKMSGSQLTLLYFKIDNLTWLGDLNSAQEVSNDIDQLISKMRSFRSWTDWGYHWTYQAETAKGHYLMLGGKEAMWF